MKKQSKKSGDVRNWFYSEKVKQHFFNPYKFMKESEEAKFKADGMGQVGSSACGDMMKFWIKVDPVRGMQKGRKSNKKNGKSASNEVDKKNEKIVDCRWRTYGCGSAIASTSILAKMITEKGGMKIKDALKIKPQDIMKRLGGLPAIKAHCSVLGDQALRKAIEDYFKKTK